MPFTFEPVDDVHDVLHVVPEQFGDERGWFMETYKRTPFRKAGIEADFVQDGHSYTRDAETLRGLHYQLRPHAQGLLVRCLRGRLFDVAVDLRPDSPTYGDWTGTELSSEEPRMVWLPEGFAHGFVTLEDDTEVAYKMTAEYASDAERVVRWDDQEIGIDWPVADPTLNERDRDAPPLDVADNNFGSR